MSWIDWFEIHLQKSRSAATHKVPRVLGKGGVADDDAAALMSAMGGNGHC